MCHLQCPLSTHHALVRVPLTVPFEFLCKGFDFILLCKIRRVSILTMVHNPVCRYSRPNHLPNSRRISRRVRRHTFNVSLSTYLELSFNYMDTKFLTKYSMLNGPIPYLSVCISFTHSIVYNGFVHLMRSNTESKNKIKLYS